MTYHSIAMAFWQVLLKRRKKQSKKKKKQQKLNLFPGFRG